MRSVLTRSPAGAIRRGFVSLGKSISGKNYAVSDVVVNKGFYKEFCSIFENNFNSSSPD
jgi:hypothetical protein